MIYVMVSFFFVVLLIKDQFVAAHMTRNYGKEETNDQQGNGQGESWVVRDNFGNQGQWEINRRHGWTEFRNQHRGHNGNKGGRLENGWVINSNNEDGTSFGDNNNGGRRHGRSHSGMRGSGRGNWNNNQETDGQQIGGDSFGDNNHGGRRRGGGSHNGMRGRGRGNWNNNQETDGQQIGVDDNVGNFGHENGSPNNENRGYGRGHNRRNNNDRNNGDGLEIQNYGDGGRSATYTN